MLDVHKALLRSGEEMKNGTLSCRAVRKGQRFASASLMGCLGKNALCVCCVCVCVCGGGGYFVLFVLSGVFLHVISSLGVNSPRLLTRVRSDPIVMLFVGEKSSGKRNDAFCRV